MAEIGKEIDKAKQLLEQGELVAIPTETVYGLAADALNESAVLKVFSAKNRPRFDPLIVHLASRDDLEEYSTHIPKEAEMLAEAFWPGPLTLVLEKQPIIPDLVTSGLPTVGLRCPDHPLTLRMLQALSFPLAAPSANPFGYISPTEASHVEDQLGSKISYILDGGKSAVGIESTIIGFENNEPVVYRLGGIALERIEQLTGKIRVNKKGARMPGQIQSHYAPAKKMIIGKIDELLRTHHDTGRVAVMSFRTDYDVDNQIILSPSGNLEVAAKNLFAALRKLDQMDVSVILTELVPEEGIGRAINDRLRRGSVEVRH